MTAIDAARTTTRARRRAPGLRSAAHVGFALLVLSACATGTTAGGDDSPTEAAATGSTGPGSASPTDDASSPAPIPTPTTIAESYARNDAADVTPAARDTAPGRLLVTTWGSSTCPDLPLSADWDADRTVLSVRAAFDNGQADTPCTLDYVPTTSVLAVDDLPVTAFTVRINGTDTVVPAAQ